LTEEGRGFFQDLPLGLQDPHAATQLDELGPFLPGQWAGRRRGLGLADPGPERLVGDPEIHGHLAE